LHRLRDDDIVMFFTTSREIERLTEYTKLPDGTWVAELRAPRLRATGLSPNDCRHNLLNHFDALLAEWLTSAQHSLSVAPIASGKGPDDGPF
jgi:hypothetical protein